MSILRMWFIHADKQTYGPYTMEEVMSMLMDGTIKYTDYAFREGFANWEFIRNIPEFDRRLINPGGNQPRVSSPSNMPPSFETDNIVNKDMWYLHDGQSQTGPHSTEYIKEGLKDKTIFWTYYIWQEGMENWTEIRECKTFDRRKTKRDEKVPDELSVNTDISNIMKDAVKHEEDILDDDDIDIELEEDKTHEYQDEIEGKINIKTKDDIKSKLPLKSIISFAAVVLILFGAISLYPKFVSFLREKEAKNMYIKAIELVEIKKYQEGFETLFNIIDLYPDTDTKRKVQNYLRSKEPLIKSSLAEEANRIRTLMVLFVNKYGVLPANAVDISYVPDFWLKYFGEVYYKWDTSKKIYLMVYGVKRPVEGYLYSLNGNGEELESELKKSDFQSKRQEYIKLEYTGEKTQVKPIFKPKPKPKPVPKKVEPKEQKIEDYSEVPVGVPEEKPIEEEAYEESYDEEPVGDDLEEPKEEYVEEEPEEEYVDEEPSPPAGDEYGDLIDTIKEDR